MKNSIRWIATFMALVLALTMLSACNTGSGDDGDDMKPITITIGIPANSDSPDWAAWESMLNQWKEDLYLFEKVNLKYCEVPDPSDKKAVKRFIQKVKSGKVACFFSPQYDYILDTMIKKDESIARIYDVERQYNEVLAKYNDAVLTIAREKDLSAYMFPYVETYQGLFFNTELAKNLNPDQNTWDALLAECAELKKAGVKPLAAGFQDEGLQYLVEEMILSEGGTAEHSYLPSFGVVSSWERAVEDIKALMQAGMFDSSAFNTSFEDAKQEFLDGKAAMIIAPASAFDGMLDEDKISVMPFPNAPNGKRENGAFIGDIKYGLYLSSACMNKSDTRYSEILIELAGDDYFNSPDFYSLFLGQDSIAADGGAYYSENAETVLDTAKEKLLKNAEAADWPLSNEAYAYDAIIEGFRKALTGANAEDALQEATDAELAAMEAARNEG